MITNTDRKGTAVPAPIVTGAGESLATFEFDIAHHVPGRLRLRSAALTAMSARASKHDAISLKLTG
jgi:hypothetical protein